MTTTLTVDAFTQLIRNKRDMSSCLLVVFDWVMKLSFGSSISYEISPLLRFLGFLMSGGAAIVVVESLLVLNTN